MAKLLDTFEVEVQPINYGVDREFTEKYFYLTFLCCWEHLVLYCIIIQDEMLLKVCT